MNPTLTRPRLALAAATIGCVTLAVRPPLLRATHDPVVVLVMVFVALLGVGLIWPVASSPLTDRSTTRWVVAGGVAAFAVGRLMGGGRAPGPLAFRVIALNTLAAVAEEAFFRRFLYGVFLPGGPLVAVAASSAMFAVVHVPVYGVWALPLDLAAGLLLAWQRWATGSWLPPAVTHVVANLLVVI
ncbi:MAG TPA: CPBP family intramembrane glutamic endopeptidase [Acidimicrobiales bacterium]|nr:CPBP family intramembrane glutamic endopeptidase [Acidimicrobiales bacterium]